LVNGTTEVMGKEKPGGMVKVLEMWQAMENI
jgi:hypothetical protein